jgi:hypothetical protein
MADALYLRQLAALEAKADEHGLTGALCQECGNPSGGVNRLVVIGIPWYERCATCGLFPGAEPDGPDAVTKILVLGPPLPGQERLPSED